jgi:hypothetical protein
MKVYRYGSLFVSSQWDHDHVLDSLELSSDDHVFFGTLSLGGIKKEWEWLSKGRPLFEVDVCKMDVYLKVSSLKEGWYLISLSEYNKLTKDEQEGLVWIGDEVVFISRSSVHWKMIEG